MRRAWRRLSTYVKHLSIQSTGTLVLIAPRPPEWWSVHNIPCIYIEFIGGSHHHYKFCQIVAHVICSKPPSLVCMRICRWEDYIVDSTCRFMSSLILLCHVYMLVVSLTCFVSNPSAAVADHVWRRLPTCSSCVGLLWSPWPCSNPRPRRWRSQHRQPSPGRRLRNFRRFPPYVSPSIPTAIAHNDLARQSTSRAAVRVQFCFC